MGTQLDDVQLIKLIQKHPILYDKVLGRGPGNAIVKDDIWRKVSQQLNCSERACITRWKSLRDRFGKELKRAQDNPEETVNWDMFEHLLFLKDHYKHGSTFVNIKYEPKKLKRGRKRLIHKEKEGLNCDGDDVDAEELIANQQLIELVKEHPVLYDKVKIRDSKNLTLKNDAWREISESMGISEEECYKRWKLLRDRFAREYRHQKLYPEQPVMWVYFQDLLFLKGHYRKGLPLPVETMMQKKKAKVAQANGDDTGDEECMFIYEENEQDALNSESIDTECTELNTNSMDELIILSNNEESRDNATVEDSQNMLMVTTTQASTSQESIQNIRDGCVEGPEQKLTVLISGIQQVLQQSHECLKSLQKQKEEHKQELQSVAFPIISEVNMLQKVHILLDGLNGTHRSLAERRIVQFLCECQIKTLNNEDIEDVSSARFF